MRLDRTTVDSGTVVDTHRVNQLVVDSILHCPDTLVLMMSTAAVMVKHDIVVVDDEAEKNGRDMVDHMDNDEMMVKTCVVTIANVDWIVVETLRQRTPS